MNVHKLPTLDASRGTDHYADFLEKNREWQRNKIRRNDAKKLHEQAETKEMDAEQAAVEHTDFTTLLEPHTAKKANLNAKNLSATQNIMELTRHISSTQWVTLLQTMGMQDLCPMLDQLVSEFEAQEKPNLEPILSQMESKLGKSKSQLYLGLNYLQDKLKQVKRQANYSQAEAESFETELEEVVDKYAKQHFEYLVNYFVPTEEEPNSIETQQGVSSDAMSLIRSGKLRLATVHQVLTFILQSYQGKPEKLISLFLRVKAAKLEQLVEEDNHKAYTSLVQELRAIRCALQCYKQGDVFNRRIGSHSLQLQNRDQFLQALVGFIDTKFWTEFGLQNLFRNNLTGYSSAAVVVPSFIHLVRGLPLNAIYGPKKLPELLKFLDQQQTATAKTDTKPKTNLLQRLELVIASSQPSPVKLSTSGQASLLWLYLFHDSQLKRLLQTDNLIQELDNLKHNVHTMPKADYLNPLLLTIITKLARINSKLVTPNLIYSFNKLDARNNPINTLLTTTLESQAAVENSTIKQIVTTLSESQTQNLFTTANQVANLQDQINSQLDQTQLSSELPQVIECNLALNTLVVNYHQQLKVKLGSMWIEPNLHELVAVEQATGLMVNNTIQILPQILANHLKAYINLSSSSSFSQLRSSLSHGLMSMLGPDGTTHRVALAQEIATLLIAEAITLKTTEDGLLYTSFKHLTDMQLQLSSAVTDYSQLIAQQLPSVSKEITDSKLDAILKIVSQVPQFGLQQLVACHKLILGWYSLIQKLGLQTKCGQFKSIEMSKLISNLPIPGSRPNIHE